MAHSKAKEIGILKEQDGDIVIYFYNNRESVAFTQKNNSGAVEVIFVEKTNIKKLITILKKIK